MEENEFVFETDEVEALTDVPEDKFEDRVVAFVRNKFNKAKDKRLADETRWLKAYANYRGQYGPDVQFTDAEKSRVFVKVTKTKVLAAYGQITEVLFGNNSFPLTVDHTRLPEGVVEDVHFDPQGGPPATPPKPNPTPFGTRGGKPLPPGATQHDLMNLGALEEKLAPIKDKLVAGPGTTPTAVTFHPAQVAAKKMEKKIHDQLEESNASKHLRQLAFEMALFGEGVMKGPFALDKEYPKWTDQGEYEPSIKTVPMTSYVSIWNFYPDPDAANMDECEHVVERHKMSYSQLKDLKARPYFRKDAIDRACEYGAAYHKEYWESVMEDDSSGGIDIDRWEVLEFWGYVPIKTLEEYDIPMSKDMKKLDQVNVNAWICNGEVIRIVLNPFKPSRIPYYAVPYELNPYSFFGIGVAENMEDSQLLMNGFMRMAVDNAVLSGNLIIEVDEGNLTPGQDLQIYPGKVFKRAAGAPGQAIFGTEFPNVSNQNMMLFDKARVLADESTGLPSYSYGQTGIQGVGRTASGISMMMSAANGSIRTVVKNLDDYLLGPLGRAFFSFNMQFDFDPEIKGDLEVNARGTESLMANEVRSQRLMQFLGVVSNPVLAPFAKLDVIVREIAKSLDLDPDKVTNSLPDAAIQAEVLKGFMPQDPAAAGGPPPAGLDVSSGPGSGGGQMGTGGAPTPGEQGFSANTGGQ